MAHTPEEQRNLDLVLAMYHEVLIKMDASKVDQYISPDYLQHSSLAPPGRDALKQFLETIRKQSPDARTEIKRAFVDGDHVVCHVHVMRFPGDPWSCRGRYLPRGRQIHRRALGCADGSSGQAGQYQFVVLKRESATSGEWMSIRFANKVVLVIGGNSGIGPRRRAGLCGRGRAGGDHGARSEDAGRGGA